MLPFRFPAFLREPSVVFEDENILVVHKPAGLHTSLGSLSSRSSSRATLLSWVVERYADVGRVAGRGGGEGGLLHRLDRDTSGLVLFARDEETFKRLMASSERGDFRKEYVLRARPGVDGPPGCRPPMVSPEGVPEKAWFSEERTNEAGANRAETMAALLKETLGKGRKPRVESLFRAFGPGAARVACAAPGADLGKKREEWGKARYSTSIEGVRTPDSQGVLELRVSLVQGFRHQIRAHMAWIGLPLLGDTLYGGAPADRLYLHASALSFPHPGTGGVCSIEG